MKVYWVLTSNLWGQPGSSDWIKAGAEQSEGQWNDIIPVAASNTVPW